MTVERPAGAPPVIYTSSGPVVAPSSARAAAMTTLSVPPVTAPRAPPAAPSGPPLWPGDGRACVVLVARSPEELAAHVGPWQALVRAALEPNAFHEPWFLLPALRAFGAAAGAFVVLVYGRPPRQPGGRPVLCGLFPLVRRRLHPLLPVSVLSVWRHDYAFFGTPLVRADCAAATLSALFEWLRHDRLGATLLRLDNVSTDGPFARALVDSCNAALRPSFVVDAHTRPVIEVRPGRDGDDYLREALSADRHKDLRRKERLLRSAGKLELRQLGPGEEAGPWAEAFLELEARGWKGRAGTAMLCRPGHAAFFRAATCAAAAAGRLQMLGLFLDGRAVALKCNFLSPPSGFAFKIAFDESQSRASPGLLLEIDNLRHLHRHPEVRCLDSCASGEASMFERFCLERRAVQTTLVASGRRGGDLAVSLLPVLRWLKRKAARPAPPQHDYEGP